jgi:hypothetical protein
MSRPLIIEGTPTLRLEAVDGEIRLDVHGSGGSCPRFQVPRTQLALISGLLTVWVVHAPARITLDMSLDAESATLVRQWLDQYDQQTGFPE